MNYFDKYMYFNSSEKVATQMNHYFYSNLSGFLIPQRLVNLEPVAANLILASMRTSMVRAFSRGCHAHPPPAPAPPPAPPPPAPPSRWLRGTGSASLCTGKSKNFYISFTARQFPNLNRVLVELSSPSALHLTRAQISSELNRKCELEPECQVH